MSTITIEVPREYGYVLISAIGTCLVGYWHGLRIGGFRKAAKIPYPQHYASPSQIEAAPPERKKAMYLFNCAQRAHGNFMENHLIVLTFMLISGARYPIATASLGGVWSLFRVVYAVGYTQTSKTNGSGRLKGSGQYLGLVGLLGLAIKTSWDFLNM